jgi:phage baseplate assembly protein W
MLGMSRTTGKALGGDAHLAQSIGDILTTPIGSRVGRRDYGSLLPELIDQPMNPAGRIRLFAATAMAIARWEPRIRLTRVSLTGAVDGAFALLLEGQRTDSSQPNSFTRLTIPVRTGSGLAAYA